jgi:hypothetical protein
MTRLEYEIDRSRELDSRILELLDGYELMVSANSLTYVLGAVLLKSEDPRALAKAFADALCEAIEHSLARGRN